MRVRRCAFAKRRTYLFSWEWNFLLLILSALLARSFTHPHLHFSWASAPVYRDIVVELIMRWDWISAQQWMWNYSNLIGTWDENVLKLLNFNIFLFCFVDEFEFCYKYRSMANALKIYATFSEPLLPVIFLSSLFFCEWTVKNPKILELYTFFFAIHTKSRDKLH